jgi:glycosyltransferase involved in cell wall biosynthesis
MRIGIDAKWYFNGPPSGINVVRNIVNNLIALPYKSLILIVDSKDSNRIDEILSKRHSTTDIEILYVKNYFNFITNLFILPFYLKNKNIDAVLFQNFIPLWGIRSTKKIAYIHDFLFVDFPQYFTFIEKLVYKFIRISALKAHHIITISNTEKERICKNCNLNDSKISFVYHGIDEMFFPRNKDEINAIKLKYKINQDYILYVGRLNLRKNIKTLLESFSQLQTDYKLVIIGAEHTKSFNLLKEVARLNLQEKVIKFGYVDDFKLSEVTAAASIFVFPTFAEGFGLPPIEAMKSGVPTIVSNVTCLPEICGKATVYFNPYSVVDLTNKLMVVIKNNNLREDLRNIGIEHSKKYNWTKSAEYLYSIIEKNV